MDFGATLLLGTAKKCWKKVLIGFFLKHLTWVKWNNETTVPGVVPSMKRIHLENNFYKQKKLPNQNCCVGHTAFPYSTSRLFMLLPHLQDGPVNCNLALEHSLSEVAWEIHVIKINLAWSNAGNCQNTRVSYITNSELTWNVADGVLVGLGSFTIYFPVLITGLDSKKPGNSCSGLCAQITYPSASKSCYSQRLLKNTEMTGKVTVKVKSANPPKLWRWKRYLSEISVCQIRVLCKMTSMGHFVSSSLAQPQSCANWNPLWKLNQYKPDSDLGLPSQFKYLEVSTVANWNSHGHGNPFLLCLP